MGPRRWDQGWDRGWDQGDGTKDIERKKNTKHGRLDNNGLFLEMICSFSCSRFFFLLPVDLAHLRGPWAEGGGRGRSPRGIPSVRW